MRMESAQEVDCQGAGRGWLHDLSEKAASAGGYCWLDGRPPPGMMVRPPPAPSHLDSDVLRGMMARYRAGTSSTDMDRLARLLGVTTASLHRLGAAWAGVHRAWTFPMRSKDGELIGIRLRAEDGSKWAVTGSRQGLFVPSGNVPERVLICEGPTDVAAMLDLGFFAVGRPSCSGGEELLIPLVRKRDVVIVSDRDEPKKRPDGSVFYPGQEGATRLADRLVWYARGLKMIRPPKAKDARAWVNAGATAGDVEMVIRDTAYWRRKEMV